MHESTSLGESEEVLIKPRLEAAQIADPYQEGLFTTFTRMILEWKRKTVLILGFSGAGKTSLLQSVFGATVPEEEYDQPTSRVNEYIFQIGETWFKAADTPGHPTLESMLRAEIDRLVRGDYHGVINVVAFGYNQSRHHKQLRDTFNTYTPLQPNHTVNPNYLQKERDLEVAYLNNWVSVIGPQARLQWVLTIANKVDMWASQLEEAIEYYGRSGKYANIIKDRIGSVDHMVCPMVSDSGGFYGIKEVRPDKLDELQKRLSLKFRDLLHARLSS